MTDSEIRRLIKEVLREELAPISMSKIVSNAGQNRTTFQRTSSDSPFADARNVQPWGFRSRAPVGTEALAVPVGGNSTHINVVGHFDESSPAVQDGESIMYDIFGHVVYLSETKIQIGSISASTHALVLGDIFKTFMDEFLQAFLVHTHEGNLGYATGVPLNAADVEAIKASPIDDGAILSTTVFTE